MRKGLFIVIFCSFIFNLAGQDTVYVDEVDTVFVDSPPVIIDSVIKRVIEPPVETKNPKHRLTISAGFLKDYNYYSYCDLVADNLESLRAESLFPPSLFLDFNYAYLLSERWSIASNLAFRSNTQKIIVRSTSMDFYSTTQSTNWLVGGGVNYQLFQFEAVQFNLYAGLNYFATTNTKGQMLSGLLMNEIVDLTADAYYAPTNWNV